MNLADILGERLAIVGGTGSGKSYTARGLVERVLARAHGRVGIIDPTGVWHGLRVNADGTPGFPVVIFGGDRSDVPLIETAGRVVAQAVASTHQSWIIDTSALKTKAAERRFMLDFLDALFEANRAEITLVVDEADRFSPQRMSPEAARLHERMEEIVRRGRVRGFTPWLITQRPASLNKDVLSQATAMICMRMTGAHDRSAMADVIEGQADKATAREIIAGMPKHKDGHGLVWAPQRGLLEEVHFPRIVTLDTMRAPKPGERLPDKPLPPIDVSALREKLAAVKEEAAANDPKVLRAEISRLQREFAKRAPAEVPEHIVRDAEARGWREGRSAGAGEVRRMYGERIQAFTAALDAACRALLAPMPALEPVAASRPTVSPSRPNLAKSGNLGPFPATSINGSGLAKAERLILTVLAQRHPERVPVERIAAIAGYSAGGGGFNNAISSLRTKGLIEPGPSPLAITSSGIAGLGSYEPLPTGPDLLNYWMNHRRVGKAERSVLEALATHGSLSKEEIAAEAGYEATGGGFNNCLSRLRTLGLITGRGTLELHEDLR